jgi:hypothetical protein
MTSVRHRRQNSLFPAGISINRLHLDQLFRLSKRVCLSSISPRLNQFGGVAGTSELLHDVRPVAIAVATAQRRNQATEVVGIFHNDDADRQRAGAISLRPARDRTRGVPLGHARQCQDCSCCTGKFVKLRFAWRRTCSALLSRSRMVLAATRRRRALAPGKTIRAAGGSSIDAMKGVPLGSDASSAVAIGCMSGPGYAASIVASRSRKLASTRSASATISVFFTVRRLWPRADRSPPHSFRPTPRARP